MRIDCTIYLKALDLSSHFIEKAKSSPANHVAIIAMATGVPVLAVCEWLILNLGPVD